MTAACLDFLVDLSVPFSPPEPKTCWIRGMMVEAGEGSEDMDGTGFKMSLSAQLNRSTAGLGRTYGREDARPRCLRRPYWVRIMTATAKTDTTERMRALGLIVGELDVYESAADKRRKAWDDDESLMLSRDRPYQTQPIPSRSASVASSLRANRAPGSCIAAVALGAHTPSQLKCVPQTCQSYLWSCSSSSRQASMHGCGPAKASGKAVSNQTCKLP